MTKRLTRSRSNRMLGGVCGGIADHFGIDISIVRILTLLFIFSGGGTLAYIAAWILIPCEPDYCTN